MSEIIIDYARPFLNAEKNDKEQKKALSIAIAIWNLSLYPKEMQSEYIGKITEIMTASRKDSRLSENEKEVLNFLMERKSSGYSPISRKVLSGLRKTINRKVIDISELKNAKIHAENLEKSVITEKELAVLNPLHGVYAYGRNKISVFIEQIAELPALSKLTNAYADAGDIYMPSGPPMSPLTKSYFLCWGFFDLCAGIKKELKINIVLMSFV